MSVEALKTLTEPEATVFYWVCKGKTYEDIGVRMGYSPQWVTLQMSSVYQKLEFDLKAHWTARRRLLREVYCPAFLKLIDNKPANLKNFPLVIEGQTQDSGEGIGEEAPKALVPMEQVRAIVVADEEQAVEDDERKKKEYERAQTPIVIPKKPTGKGPRREPWPLWLRIGGGIALVGICSGLCFAGAGGGLYLLSRPSAPHATNVPVVNTTEPPPVITEAPALEVPATEMPTAEIPMTERPTEAPTVSLDQAPAAGTTLNAGEFFSKGGIDVTLENKLQITNGQIYLHFTVYNNRASNYLLRFRRGDIHVTDSLGNEFEHVYCCGEGSGSIFSTTIYPGSNYSHPIGWSTHDEFVGAIRPEATYLVVSIDNIAGMSDVRWMISLE